MRRQFSADGRSVERPIYKLAFLLDNMNGGGVQQITISIMQHCLSLGHVVHLLVCDLRGLLYDVIPQAARVIELNHEYLPLARFLPACADLGSFSSLLPVLFARKPDGCWRHLGALAHNLRIERYDALLAATTRLNITAVWARRLAGLPTRLLLSEHTAPIPNLACGAKWSKRVLVPKLMRRTYAQADAVVAVSDGVADQLEQLTGLPRGRIQTIYNPVVSPELIALSRDAPNHAWFAPGSPPVVLSVARLADQKDLPTLLRAFARLRARRSARLLILGDAARPEQTVSRIKELRSLAAGLGIAGEVDLPGFIPNPYAFMARAALLALSSTYEGLPTVLIEAMACGCPVVSTNCPSGPAEILAGGRYGPLVPVGDDAALAAAMEHTLDHPPNPATLHARAADFSVGRATDAYLSALFGSSPDRQAAAE
jgi:glycosyltransferase involved in cell wall biosynthesis